MYVHLFSQSSASRIWSHISSYVKSLRFLSSHGVLAVIGPKLLPHGDTLKFGSDLSMRVRNPIDRKLPFRHIVARLGRVGAADL